MTDKERFMYQIMGEISKANAPIVFKGALVTKLILAENGYTAVERQTRDIDANWIGAPPSMEALVDTINNSFGELNNRVYAVAFREYGEKMSAGISICEKQTNEELISMDVDMRPIHGSKLYSYGEVSIRGVLANDILADKISVLSGKKVFRRVKDLVDVYSLTHCVKVKTTNIIKMSGKTRNREIGDFSDFYNRKQDLEHAYIKLRGILNKPPFDIIYSYMERFIQPFAAKDVTPKEWSSEKMAWQDILREKKP